MDELEEVLARLTKERQSLLKANAALQARNQQLATENGALKSRMVATTTTTSSTSIISTGDTNDLERAVVIKAASWRHVEGKS